MSRTISHLYNDYPTAQEAANELEAAGLDGSHISIVASNAERWYKDGESEITQVDSKHDRDRDGTDDRAEGAAKGAGIGGAAVGAAGLAAGLGLLAIPGIGPVVAAGWAASTLAGVVAGGVTGGVIGALVESGVSKADADVYAEAIRRGGSLVVAHVSDSEASRYQAILARSSVNVADLANSYRTAGWKGFDPAADPYTVDQVRHDREFHR